MKVYILTINCDEMSPSFEIGGVYRTERDAQKERDRLYDENPEMDFNIEIAEYDVY